MARYDDRTLAGTDRDSGRGSMGRTDDDGRGYRSGDDYRSGGGMRDRGYGDRRNTSDRDYGDQGYGSSRSDYGRSDYGNSRMGSGGMASGGVGAADSGSRGDYYNSGGDQREGRSGGIGYGSDRYGSDRGPHAGRGPEGYSRSNDRITEDVNEALTDHGGVDASKIRVSVEDGEVTLEGTVSSRREKRMAEDATESARGVRDVHNRLRISDDSDSETASGSDGRQATASGTEA